MFSVRNRKIDTQSDCEECKSARLGAFLCRQARAALKRVDSPGDGTSVGFVPSDEVNWTTGTVRRRHPRFAALS